MAKTDQKIRIFSALEVANICGVVNQTAINWIRSGHLKAFTTPGGQYRVYAEDLAAFLESRGMRIPDDLIERFKEEIHWESIIVIDDERQFNDMIRDFLSMEFPEFSILQAWDGFDAGRLILEKRPGFIILDVDLPGVDGYALCRRIKEEAVFGKPFIIAVTGHLEPEIRERILMEGADAFFAKPVDLRGFGGTIRDLYGRIKP
jgi:excisionase family DNA binding protein